MIDAIITRLKTGSVSRVYATGDVIKDPKLPYSVVSYLGVSAGQEQYGVTGHFPRGFWDSLDDYIQEALGLLSNVQLTDENSKTAVLTPSGYMGPVVDVNEDGSISRELTFIAPGMIL